MEWSWWTTSKACFLVPLFRNRKQNRTQRLSSTPTATTAARPTSGSITAAGTVARRLVGGAEADGDANAERTRHGHG